MIKGIGTLLTKSLMRALGKSKPKPKPNRRLTPEEIAEKYPKKDIGYPFTKDRSREKLRMLERTGLASPMRARQVGDEIIGAPMRARQVGDETMEMVRRSVSKKGLPPTVEKDVIRKAMDAMQAMPLAQLAKRNPIELAQDLLKFGLGASVGYGVADNKEAIAEMLRSTKMDGGDYTLPFEQLIPGAGLMGALGGSGLEMGGFPQGRKQQLSSGPIPMRPGNRGQLFDRPRDPLLQYEEPGLEEGSIMDLLLINPLLDKMFED